jgi:hypothetical protein
MIGASNYYGYLSMTQYKGFEQLVRRGVLETIDRYETTLGSTSNDEALLEQTLSGSLPPDIKNVCAKVSKDLADRIDTAAALCSCTKRKFIEQALQQAVRYVDEVAEREGLNDLME